MKHNDVEYLKEQIFETTQELERVKSIFDEVTDKEVMDTCIYQMTALERKLSYLYKQIKFYKEMSEIA